MAESLMEEITTANSHNEKQALAAGEIKRLQITFLGSLVLGVVLFGVIKRQILATYEYGEINFIFKNPFPILAYAAIIPLCFILNIALNRVYFRTNIGSGLSALLLVIQNVFVYAIAKGVIALYLRIGTSCFFDGVLYAALAFPFCVRFLIKWSKYPLITADPQNRRQRRNQLHFIANVATLEVLVALLLLVASFLR